MYNNLKFFPATTMCMPTEKCLGLAIVGLYEEYTLGIKPTYMIQYSKNEIGSFGIVYLYPTTNSYERIFLKKEEIPENVKIKMKEMGYVEV